MGLDFGAHADVVFDRAPLTTVLCQVRFPPVLSLLAQAGLTGFQTALRDQYPILLPAERTASVEVSAESATLQTTPPVWRLTDVEKVWTVGLAVDFASLETSRYTNIEDFLSRFTTVLQALHRTIRPADSIRIGLRKVNAIEAPPEERNTSAFLGVVRRELLGALAVEHFPASIAASFTQLQFAEDYNALVVRYGLQDANERMTFVIDMDYYTEQPYQVDGGEQLSGLLRHFSEGMTSFFHFALEDEYKQTLGPRPRIQGVESL